MPSQSCKWVCWESWGRLGSLLGGLGGVLEPLGRSWGVLGASWRPLGGCSGSLGGLLGVFWELLQASWRPLGGSWERSGDILAKSTKKELIWAKVFFGLGSILELKSMKKRVFFQTWFSNSFWTEFWLFSRRFLHVFLLLLRLKKWCEIGNTTFSKPWFRSDPMAFFDVFSELQRCYAYRVCIKNMKKLC